MVTSASEFLVPARRFLRMCRRSMRRPKIADSTGLEMTGGQLLVRSLVLRRLLRRQVLGPDERHVGVLLPPSAGGVLANAAVSLDARVAVNLNYTLSAEVLNEFCIRAASVRHVLTSRKVLERFPLRLDAELVFLEELRERVTARDKATAALAAWCAPIPMLERSLGLPGIDADEVFTIIFTAGSTGEPKGAMLTHRNVGSNMDAFNEVIRLHDRDVLTGILPFFHSFGFTTTLWSALTLGPKGVYHYSPLDARQVGKLSREHGATILVATPTFLRSYLRRCEPSDFAALNTVIAGAEHLPQNLSDEFQRRFGVRPTEGYGCTELSPVVSCNLPNARAKHPEEPGRKEGTVGPPLPGLEAKVVDLDTGADLGRCRPGMLLIRGPNVMKGYLSAPEKTAQVIRDGWYTTGDVAVIDEEGFIRITGRESRFSKIGGEMVPHLRIEEAIAELLNLDPEVVHLAVTSVPHPTKGERIVVLHTGLSMSPEQICGKLGEMGLPPIWIPLPDSFRQVEEIPMLGTGKLDLRGVRQRAAAEFASGHEE